MSERIKSLQLHLGEHSYKIEIGCGLLSDSSCLAGFLQGRPLVILSDETVASLYLPRLQKILSRAQTITLPSGEQHKTLETFADIIGQLLSKNMGRQTILCALGGGVVGDITGFVAACYQRGIDFVQLPTTLLAQVDSSVGGKTGVNHRLGKNMIGAFHQPRAVIIDLETLETLPPRELSAGLAEVIKYGLIEDADFFVWLEENIASLLQKNNHRFSRQNYDAWAYMVHRSCAIKAAIVEQDEKESGARMLLNLGHSFAHAIETASNYDYLHGEAVACGLVLATQLSTQLGYTDPSQLQRVRQLLQAAGLPIKRPPSCCADVMLELMARDKKNRPGRQTLVLLKTIGEAFVEPDMQRKVLATFLSQTD